MPLEYEQSHDIVMRTRDVIGATIYGVLAISAIQGTLGFLIFLVLGLPSPLLWGVVMFLMSMIPMAGRVRGLGAGGALPAADRQLRQGAAAGRSGACW